MIIATIIKVALTACAVAGTLDIFYALASAWAANRVPPTRLLQFIATGLMGTKAYRGGIKTALFGLFLHYVIMLCMVLAFIGLVLVIPSIASMPVASGAIYGGFLFVAMNYAIVPMSKTVPRIPLKGIRLAGEIFAHTVLVGIPISVIVTFLLK